MHVEISKIEMEPSGICFYDIKDRTEGSSFERVTVQDLPEGTFSSLRKDVRPSEDPVNYLPKIPNLTML